MKTSVAASLGIPAQQVAAIQAAVEQIQSGLTASQTVVSELRAQAAKLTEMADLLETITAAEEPPMKKDDEKKEEEEEKDPSEKPKEGK